MNGKYTPPLTSAGIATDISNRISSRSLSATYSLAANASSEVTVTADSLTGTYKIIGILGFTTGANDVMVRRIAVESTTSVKMSLVNVTSNANNNKTASVVLMLLKTS